MKASKQKAITTPPVSGIKKMENDGEAVFLGSGINFSKTAGSHFDEQEIILAERILN